MGEYVANDVQNVGIDDNVIFSDTTVRSGRSIYHKNGSGLTTLRSYPTRCGYAKFIVTFGANVALAEEEEEKPIALAIAINGETLSYTKMITETLTSEIYSNIGRTVVLELPAGCCAQVSVKNVGEGETLVRNATLLVDRIA